MNKLGIWAIALATVLISGALLTGFAYADEEDNFFKKIIKQLKKIVVAIENQEISVTSSPACPAENVQHWETLAWGSSIAFQHPTLPSVSGGNIKAQADPNEVFTYTELVASKLNDLGYSNSGNPITSGDIGTAIQQGDSQLICAES